ncbi:hypothetical protein M434DRAFT_29139 [Hypoxylon sp. CO27-5]|nr:hypothetical protein M434DRAFT_29139 [Hypoxylon sp. CO27-5]
MLDRSKFKRPTRRVLLLRSRAPSIQNQGRGSQLFVAKLQMFSDRFTGSIFHEASQNGLVTLALGPRIEQAIVYYMICSSVTSALLASKWYHKIWEYQREIDGSLVFPGPSRESSGHYSEYGIRETRDTTTCFGFLLEVDAVFYQ